MNSEQENEKRDSGEEYRRENFDREFRDDCKLIYIFNAPILYPYLPSIWN